MLAISTCQSRGIVEAAGSPPKALAAGGGSSASAAAAVEQRFDVHEYRVLGNTVLTNRQIESVLYPRLGDGKTLTDVQAARAALEAAYHALGYATVFVDIPPQDVTDGIVRLHVVEGRVRERMIHGARYFSEGKILAQLPEILPGTVPRIPELQRELNAVNSQTPDRSVVPVLKAGPVPGTMDVALDVNDKPPLHGSLEIDNEYTPDTKPLRATVGLSYDNLFNELDTVSAQFTTSPQDTGEVQVLNVSYGFHPLGPGIRPSISFTNSSSNVATIGTLGVLGDGQVYSARLAMPLIVLPGDYQSATLGIDYKHFRNTIDLASTGVLIEPVAYTNLSLTYTGAWERADRSGTAEQTALLDIGFDAGPRGITNDTQNFENNRYQARGNYAYLRADATLTTRLPAGIQLTLRGSGQAALEPLVVYEQESFTGSDGVRGYLEGEVLGDTGIKGSLQFQSPPIVVHRMTLGNGFLFFDAGHAHSVDALAGEPGHTILRSFGAGIDLFPGRAVTSTVTWADPLLTGPRTVAHDSWVLFDVKGSF